MFTLVIGAGAAGIAAARCLHDAGADVLLIEAKPRLGGRAHSILLAGGAIDLGCGWLHSAKRNPWSDIARTRGFTIDTDTAHWGEQWRDLGFPAAEREAFSAAWDRWEAAAHAALDGPDRPLSDFVQDEEWRPMLDAISGYANGANLAKVSLHDWAAYEDASTRDNWAVREGYGTLIADHAAGVPLRLGLAATCIDRSGVRLKVETPQGTIEADRVIVAVPTTTLARGELKFDPPLDDHAQAASDLPLGIADKVFVGVAGAVDWPANAHLAGDPHDACTASYRLSPLGLPLIEAFFGGDTADALEERDAFAFVADELARLFGSGIRSRLIPLVATRWRHEPHIHGGYSHARIGRAAQRQVLATPVEDRIFFAGEACSKTDFSTAHGAYATGIEAAEAVLRSSRPPR
jgi:monoamine oxidase